MLGGAVRAAKVGGVLHHQGFTLVVDWLIGWSVVWMLDWRYVTGTGTD